MNRGSEWRKWDLHIHTPESFQNEFRFTNKPEAEKYRNDLWQKYIDELEKVTDISAIGVTDYFSIEGFKKVIDCKNAGRLNNFDLILPNIEFRIDKFVQDRRLNFHVIFSEAVNINQIEKEFLEDLDISAPNVEPRKLTRENMKKEHWGRVFTIDK